MAIGRPFWIRIKERRAVVVTAAVSVLLSLVVILSLWISARNNQPEADQEPIALRFSSSQSFGGGEDSVHAEDNNKIEVSEEEIDDVFREALELLDDPARLEEVLMDQTLSDALAGKTPVSSEDLLALVKEGIEFHDNLLHTVSADLAMELWASPESASSDHTSTQETWEVSFVSSGSKIAYSATESSIISGSAGDLAQWQEHTYAFDGEVAERLSVTPNGSILSMSSSTEHHKFYLDPRYWGWSLNSSGALGQIIDNYTMESVKSAQLDGDDVFVYKGTGRSGNVRVEMWINPSKAYRPERFDFFAQSGHKEVRTTRTYTLKEYGNGLWFPERASDVHRETDLNTGVSQTALQRNVYISNVTLNTPVPESAFHIPRQPGLEVVDERTNTRYIVE